MGGKLDELADRVDHGRLRRSLPVGTANEDADPVDQEILGLHGFAWASTRRAYPPPMRAPEPGDGAILCLGEAIVDLLCEEVVADPAQAARFRPHFGGALANVAVAIARAGADVAVLAGVGDDEWGSWLRARLDAEGVGLRWFSQVEELRTPIAFVTFDATREARFRVYGNGIDAAMHAAGERIDEALEHSSALVFGSNTLVGAPERELTLRARDRALERGLPVLFDPNIRPNRWARMEQAHERSRDACRGAFMVRANLDEARHIAQLDPQTEAPEAAEALCELGARVAVVTMGDEGAVARGEAEAEAVAPEVDVVAPLGAGDAFFGTLTAGVALAGWAPSAVANSLEAACAAGARACMSWGALGA